MTKQLQRLLLIAALCMPWVVNAQSSLTVADGTGTSSTIPINGSFNNYITRIQILYPADSITAMAGSTISGLTFYSANATGSWGNAVFTVRMATTTQNSLTDFVNGSSLTQCWQGSLVVADGVANIVFDEPFTYIGGNLLVDIYNLRGTASSSSFYGVTLSGVSIENHNYNGLPSSGGSQNNFLPKTTFNYGTISCLDPTNLTVTPDNSQATVAWNAGGSESNWLVYLNGNYTITTSTNSYTLSGLSPNTLYEVGVRAYCGSGDTSDMVSTTFLTQCFGYTQVPYFTDFEDVAGGDLPNCWSAPVTGTSGSGTFPSVYHYSTNAYNGAKYFEFESTSGQTEIAVLPQMDDVNTLQLEFYASCMNTNFVLEVGVYENDAHFEPVDTVELVAGLGNNWHLSYYPYIVYFDEYVGEGKNMAMRVTGSGSYTLMIDDISVSEIPSCRPPIHFAADSVGVDWIVLSWSDPYGSAWDIVYDTLPFDPAATTLTPLALTESHVELTGLATGVAYTAYVRSNCGSQSSTWVGPLQFIPGHYYMPYSGTASLVGCGMTIYDDGGENATYTRNANSVLVLYPSDNNSLVSLSGNTSLYSSYASLRIYDGVGIEGALLWQSTVSTETLPQITSYSGPVTIHFSAGNYNGNYPGFEINVTCVDAPGCASVRNLQVPNISVGSAYVSWAVEGSNWGDPTGCEVACYDTAGTAVYTGMTTSNSALISGLLPANQYVVTVRTQCGDSYGEYDTVAFTTARLDCQEIDTANSHFDTIGNGTIGNSYLPSFSYFSYSLTQQIYTAGEIGHGGVITALSLMPSAVGGDRMYQIYLAHTTADSLTGFVHPADMTLVYSGTTSLSAGQWAEFSFDQPFSYNGSDNLLVCFRDMTGSWVSGNSWYAHTTTTRQACCAYRDGGAYDPYTATGGNVILRRNNIAISMTACSQQASCAAPVVIVDSVSTNFVSIRWGAGYQETSWSVEHRAEGDIAWVSDGTVSTPSWSFSGLNANTQYTFRIGALCSGDTRYAEVDARTLCSPEPLPFTCDFEDFPSSGYPSCWYKATSYSNSSYPLLSNAQAHSGDHSIYMYSTPGTYSYIVLPEMATAVDSLEVNFWMYQNNPSDANNLYVGVISDVERFSTFETVGIVHSSQEYTWVAVRVSLDGYTGSGTRVAIASPTSDNVGIYIDDITVNTISGCAGVEGVSLVGVTVDSAVVGWNSSNALVVEYVYGPMGFAVDSVSAVHATADTVVLAGLAPSTIYDIYVRTVCGPGDTSHWSPVYSFHTDCKMIDSIPYADGFEANRYGWHSYGGGFYPCWYRGGIMGSLLVDSYYARTGTGGVYWSVNANSTNTPYMVLPAIDANAVDISQTMLSFWAYRGVGNIYDYPHIVVGTMTDPQDFSTFQPLDTIIVTSEDWAQYQVPLNNSSIQTVNQSSIQYIALASVSTNLSWWAGLDDVLLDSIPACLPVAEVAVTGNTYSSVSLSWTENGNAAMWEVYYDTVLSDTPGASVVVTGTPAATVTGLTGGMTYYFWVRSLCSATDTSSLSAPVSCIPGLWTMRPNQTDTLYMCGGIITDDGGLDGTYSSSQSSYIILRPDIPGSSVAVSGSSYTEGQYDYLIIYDGEGTDGTELWSDYGVNASQTFGPIYSTSGSLTIYFHSDGVVTLDGFDIDVSCFNDNCPVSDLSVDADNMPTSSSIALTWAGSSPSYQVLYGPAGFDVDEGTLLTTLTNSIVITSLEQFTAYDIYVRGLCSGGDTGMWQVITVATAMCDGVVEVLNYDTAQADTTTSYSPIGFSYYNYSHVQTIIPAGRLAALTGDVNAMAFNPATVFGGSHFTGMTVWLANVSEDRFDSAAFIHPDANHLFKKVIVEGSDMSYGSTGWQIHRFDSTFTWDGHSNILVTVSCAAGSWTSSGSFEAHVDSVYRVCYDYRDSDPYSLATATVGTGAISAIVGDIKLFTCGMDCAKPILLPVSDVTFASATVSWQHNSADTFELSVKSEGDDWSDQFTIHNSQFTIHNLQPNEQYQYRVRAVCDVVDWVVSDWAEGSFVTDSLPCYAPTNFANTAVDLTTAVFSWTAGGDETAWRIHVWNATFDQTYSVTTNPATVAGLSQNTTYNASVVAVCGGGMAESEESNVVQFTTAECSVPTDVAATNVHAHGATITWSGSAPAYSIEYGRGNFATGSGILVEDISGTTYTITGLSDASEYRVQVRAQCDDQNVSAWSERIAFTTPEETGIDDGTQAALPAVAIYPNPTSDAATISLNGINGEVTVTVVDMNGRTLRTQTIHPSTINNSTIDSLQYSLFSRSSQPSAHNSQFTILNLDGLAAGSYFVRIAGESVNTVKKLVVK